MAHQSHPRRSAAPPIVSSKWGIMKYLCLVVVDEQKLAAMSGQDAKTLDDMSLDYANMLDERGQLLSSYALQSTQAATTVRVRSGNVLVTDGPFAESNEQVGGYLLIEAVDLNEAIAIAAKQPGAVLGGVEIRPVRDLRE
jgi:hypothetical protein